MIKRIGYQGEAGANSHIACNLYDKKSKPIALKTFDEVFVSLGLFRWKITENNHVIKIRFHVVLFGDRR